MNNFEFIPHMIKSTIVLEKTKIPRVFIQTFRNNHVHKDVYQNIQNILNMNKSFTYLLITDSIGIELIKKYFDKKTLDAFKKLKTGAAKGDFLRYITLYLYGGVYLDMDSTITKDISKYLHNDFVWVYDGSPNFIQWFFMTSPKHYILKAVIEEMVLRIHNNESNIFLATGPTLVCDVIFGLLKKENIYNSNISISSFDRNYMIQHSDMNDGLFMLEDEMPIKFTFDGYTKDMLYDKDNPRYIPVWNTASIDLYN